MRNLFGDGSHSRFPRVEGAVEPIVGSHARVRVAARREVWWRRRAQFGETRGVGDGGRGALADRRPPSRSAGAQILRELVVDGAGLVALTHRTAHATEHLPELGEHLARVRPDRTRRPPATARAAQSECTRIEAERLTGRTSLTPALLAARRILVAVRVVIGVGEAKAQIAHSSHGTRRGPAWPVRRSRSRRTPPGSGDATRGGLYPGQVNRRMVTLLATLARSWHWASSERR